MRLGKSYSPERLEAACRRALTLGACSYKSIELYFPLRAYPSWVLAACHRATS
jgi:hypothetical protein